MSGPRPRDGLALLRSQLFVPIPQPSASFADQTVIVTGANTGLGLLAAQHIVRLGASRVILGVRDAHKGSAALASIEAATKRRGVVEVWPLDMAHYPSVVAFGRRAAGLERLDAVVLNAGTWPTKFEMAEGNEMTITVNVLATFLLLLLLLPVLRRSAADHRSVSRVTVVSSALHKFATLSARQQPSMLKALSEPVKAGEFDPRYQDSKLLVMLYGRRLAQAMAANGAAESVVLTMVNPGYCRSKLRIPTTSSEKLMESVLARSTDAGAFTLVDAVKPLTAQEAKARHGAYIDDTKVKSPAAWLESKEGKDTAERVWKEVNEVLEGVVSGVTAGLV